jgi:hypothetical protein
MIDFNDFTFHKSRLPKEFGEQDAFFKDLEKAFYAELRDSDHAKAYLEQFNARHIDYFMETYARKKVELAKAYEYYNEILREKEDYELSFHKKAEYVLEAILQKKLFNLQLLWRAGQQQIEGIDICYDFHFWESHIASCPFIPSIEEHEKEVMKEYLLTANEFDNEIDSPMVVSWQDYDELTQKDEHGHMEDMIAWYEFYDSRMGTGALLNLPDLKKEKETFYLRLVREKNGQHPIPYVNEDHRPLLIGLGDELIAFAKFFESDKYFIQLFKGYEIQYTKESRIPFPEDVELSIAILSSADRPIYLPSHLIWDEAIVYAAKHYNNVKVAEALDVVYEEYRMFDELGLSFKESPETIKKAYEKDDITQMVRKLILQGRALNGEPEDFNY